MFTRKTCSALTVAALTLAVSLPVSFATSSPAALAEEAATKREDTAVFKEIQDLFKEYYPKAATSSSDTKLHFDFKCRQEIGYYSGRPVMAPQTGGIFCDISLQPGKYEGKDKDRLPSETQDGFHSDLMMAEYSKQKDQHLLVHLSFPPDMATDFKERLKTVVRGFNANEPAEVATAAAKPTAAASTTSGSASETPAAAATTSVLASTAAPSTVKETAIATVTSDKSAPPLSSEKPTTAVPTATFGGAKLSKYTFPEGRFRVELPGAPATKYATMLNMREVDYEYPQAQGTFNISYLILPGMINPGSAGLLFDKLQAAMVQAYSGTSVQQSPISSRNFPGRQVIIGGMKKKPGFAGLIRFFMVQNYVYIVGVVGRKEWVETPICNQFLASFEFSTAEEQKNATEQLRKHVAEYEQTRKQREWQEKNAQFSNDVRKKLHGNSESHGQGNYR